MWKFLFFVLFLFCEVVPGGVTRSCFRSIFTVVMLVQLYADLSIYRKENATFILHINVRLGAIVKRLVISASYPKYGPYPTY